jgi:hypothetical protein
MRPILDAMQSFAGTTQAVPAPPSPEPPRALHFISPEYEWYRPLTLADTRALLFMHGATSATAKLVNRNTSVAIYKRDAESPRLLVDVSAVPELHAADTHALRFGAGLGLAELVATPRWPRWARASATRHAIRRWTRRPRGCSNCPTSTPCRAAT